MRLRDLLNFELTKASPRRKSREFKGAELVRMTLEKERWSDWISAVSCFAIAAMYIPISIEITTDLFAISAVFSWSRMTWLILISLVIAWSPIAIYGLGLPLVAGVFERFSRPKTKFITPPAFKGWKLYFIGWVISALLLLQLLLLMILERSIIEPFKEMAFSIEILVLGWSGLFIAQGLYLRLGDTICCRRCSYPVPPKAIESPGTCTECGRDLARRSGKMIGQRRFRPALFYAGLGIVVAATVLRFV